MTELRHFHSARKGSGSLRPFPIYLLYTQTVILSLDKPIADCFLFRPRKRLEKCRKRSHTNVSNASVTRTSTPPAQAAHVRFRTRKRVHTRLSEKIAHSGSHGETGGHLCVVARSIWLPPHHSKNSRRKCMHANGVCPLSPAPQPRRAAETYFFVTAWSFLHRYQSGQQLELSIKTIRRPNVHCKTECILLQYSEKSLEWRRYTICPLSLFAMILQK